MPYISYTQTLKNIVATAVLLSSLVQSAEQNELSELDYIIDIPVTFSATRLPQSLSKAPASVSIIDRQMIEASSATTISELFRLVPGMQSYHIATNASAVAYHGMSDKFPSRMEVMIDGRSVYIPLFSAVIWESLPISIEDIERIEVVRGTNTVTQGSNAFLGAINIITHSPLIPRENMVKYRQGEFDSKTFYGRYSTPHELGYYSLSAGVTGNDGTRFASGNSDPYYNRHLTFSSSISPSLLDTLTLNLGTNAGYSYVGDINSSDKDPNLPDPKRRDFESYYQSIEWKHLFTNDHELRVQYSHSLNNYDAAPLSIATTRSAATDDVADILDAMLSPLSYTTDRDDLAVAFLDINPYKITGEIGKIEQHQLELSYQWSPDIYNKVLAGTEYRYEAAKNYQILDTQDWVVDKNSRIFAHWENSQLPDWTFNLGLSAEHGGNNSTRLSPRLAANYQLHDSVMLRTSASRAYRMPSLLESNYTTTVRIPSYPLPAPADDLQKVLGGAKIYDYIYQPNPDLKPEQLTSYDLALLAQWPEFNSELDVRVFYEKINDGITETRIEKSDLQDNTVVTFTNMSEWNNKGIELQYKYQSNSSLKPLVIFNYGYIETSGTRLFSNITNRIDPLETRNPTHTASLLTSITLPNQLQISLSHYFLASVQWLEAHRNVEIDPPNSPYHRTDLKISQKLNLSPQNELSIALIVQNLLDNPYSEFYAENMFEQRTYLQAQLSF